ncbi:GlsB/YeaQ/YmgE family stress response membrane protein [Candidatus Daviesbacteria bacterium]|nr:GlsB/YeaQ/YmgE family stress response membrane protein [Candidatus Daviesbacteria bacterium]
MNIISWIVFGLVVGIIANLIDPYPSKGGMLGSIILGILGAILGGILGNIIFGIGITGFNLPSLALAVLGALLLMFVERAFGRT